MSFGRRPQAGISRVLLEDSESIDAFSRLRVSGPTGLHASQQQFGSSPLVWDNDIAGTGSVNNSLSRASVILSTGGTASGSRAYRQNRVHHRYQPGKSQFGIMTVVVGAGVTNVRKRMGMFDANDGVFLQQLNGDLSFVIRSSTSGAPVDTVIPQSVWSEDRFDGRGPSGKILDVTKAQILAFDFQWLGAGRVRFAFDIDGVLYQAHEQHNANELDVVYMTNPNLPFRAEIENVGVASATATLEQICCSLSSEGGFEENIGIPFAVDTGASLISVTSRVPLISIRAKTTGPNAVRNTGQVLPQVFQVLAQTNPARVEIVRNPTLTGAAWTDVDATLSLAQYDTSATALSGGRVVSSFGVPAGGFGPFATAGENQKSPFVRDPIVYADLSGDQDVLTVAATGFGGATADMFAAINWQELY